MGMPLLQYAGGLNSEFGSSRTSIPPNALQERTQSLNFFFWFQEKKTIPLTNSNSNARGSTPRLPHFPAPQTSCCRWAWWYSQFGNSPARQLHSLTPLMTFNQRAKGRSQQIPGLGWRCRVRWREAAQCLGDQTKRHLSTWEMAPHPHKTMGRMCMELSPRGVSSEADQRALSASRMEVRTWMTVLAIWPGGVRLWHPKIKIKIKNHTKRH